jgi:hypothetical protein
VPTSVLLAVLAAAGLLALAPALVRRYDATERLVAERTSSTARVLERRRRRRTVPGRRPINPPRVRPVTLRASTPPSGGTPQPAGESRRSSLRLVAGPRGRNAAGPVGRTVGSGVSGAGGPGSAFGSGFGSGSRSGRRAPVRRAHPPAVYRRRRVFASLLLLNLVELIGVVAVGPGFWVSFVVTGTLLAAYTVHLRNRALHERRRRRAQAREAAWLAARQAEVRREQARRAAARRENQRRLAAQRESLRRAALGVDRGDLPAAAVGGSVSYRRTGGLRGRPYQAGPSRSA